MKKHGDKKSSKDEKKDKKDVKTEDAKTTTEPAEAELSPEERLMELIKKQKRELTMMHARNKE